MRKYRRLKILFCYLYLIKCRIHFYINKAYYWIILKSNLKLKEIPLYLIYTNQRFDLGNDSYNFSVLYKSLLKTNGLDLKNHVPPFVTPLKWEGYNALNKKAIEKGFRYIVRDGNHRIATLQFINLTNKLDINGPEIMVKVMVADEHFFTRLDRYGLMNETKGQKKLYHVEGNTGNYIDPRKFKRDKIDGNTVI
mgnify:CR=1 FL=1